MNKLLFPLLIATCVGSAFAQSATVTTIDDKGKTEATVVAETPAQKSADHYCLHETGSHLRSTTHAKGDKATDCATVVGHAYTREDIERTGATTTADALRHLDPSIH